MSKRATLFGLAALSTLLTCLPMGSLKADAVYPRHLRNVWIAPGATQVYYVTYYGDELAEVEAVGTGDIDIEVRNPAGVVVAEDTLPDSYPVCTWTPPERRTYAIRVTNCENHGVFYDLDTN